MQLGVILPQTSIGPDPRLLREFAVAADEGGFDFLLAYDHVLGADTTDRPGWQGYDLHDQFHEPLVLFGYLAAITRLELVVGVLVLPQRQTALVAKQAAEVDVLTGGRFRLGVGIGWNAVEYEALGVEFRSRARRYEEQIELLRLLWTQESVTFHGEFHSVPAAGILPRPVQQPIPVWLGGWTAPPVLDRIGRVGDGWITALPPGPELDAAVAAIRAAAERAGRDPAGIGIQGGFDVGAEIDPDRIRRQLDKWEAAGASHVSVSSLRAGRTPDRHVEFVHAMAEILARR